ncbi:hypothetical protein BKA62DRAFT_729498 [Auriculariales sp. MPI-PUGE-AT-0066]|nr:hypothetical protein BKA62DRAFT_729498 [Auriculariales sp. MPI-PUGE-AT-0066]
MQCLPPRFRRIHLDVHVELIRIIELVQKKALHAVQRAVSNAGRRVNAYAPVNRLPGDVLVEIFSNLGSMVMIQVARVCRKWRDTSRSIPTLWSRLDLYPGRRFSRDAELILAHMHGMPHGVDDGMDEYRECEAREHFTQATKLLRYRMPRLLILIFPVLQLPACNRLERLTLNWGFGQCLLARLSLQCGAYAAVTELTLNNVHEPVELFSYFPNLVYLKLQVDDPATCLDDVLQNCPSIKRISLTSYVTNHYVHCDEGDLLRGVQCLKLDGPLSMNQPASRMLSTIEVSSWQDGIDVSDAPGTIILRHVLGSTQASEHRATLLAATTTPIGTTGERWRNSFFACNNQGLRRRVNSQSIGPGQVPFAADFTSLILELDGITTPDFPSVLPHLVTLRLRAEKKTFSPEMSHKIACPALRVLELYYKTKTNKRSTFAAQDLERLLSNCFVDIALPLERLAVYGLACHAPPPVPWRATKAFAFSPNLETDHAPFPKEVFGELD